MSLTHGDLVEVAEAVGAELDPGLAAVARPRWNVAPSQPHPIVLATAERRLVTAATWGLPAERRGLHINARVETAATRRAFRAPWRDGRCLVPADGFYEWRTERGPDGKPRRMPLWFRAAGGGLLFFAGLWEPAPDGGARFVVLTTEPDETVAAVHDRMPLIVPARDVEGWLAAAALPRDRISLVATPVSPRLNSPANDDAACLEPPAATDPAVAPAPETAEARASSASEGKDDRGPRGQLKLL